MKITDYIIISDVSPHKLAYQVREKITEGYQPFGNILFTPNGFFYQPMVKYSS